MLVFCFLFFKQKTAYEMRISDWSSDVCSSDLLGDVERGEPFGETIIREQRLVHARPARAERRVKHVVEASERSEEHTSELQSLMRISYAVFCLKKKKLNPYINTTLT